MTKILTVSLQGHRPIETLSFKISRDTEKEQLNIILRRKVFISTIKILFVWVS